MDQLLPVLVGRIEHPGDVAAVIQAALRGGIAFVPLDEPPSAGGPHALELHLPGFQQPLLLIGEPAGEPLDTEFPLVLQPYAEAHRGELAAFLARIEGGGAAPTPAGVDGDRPSNSPLAGRVLGGGKYAILAQLGSGGMGSVYQARHVMLDKAIAVKVLHSSHRHSEQFLAAFHREALAASRLDHPNVVRVLDFGREPDGLLYIAMELLEGRDLRAALDEQPVPPLRRTLDVMSQVAAALSASHEQGIVHRDVKPENVFLVPRRDDDGTLREVVKVLDFGIAELIHDGGPRPEATGPRMGVAGTPDYMSPEQVRAHEVDARADIYACGVILFEMATGKVPFYAAGTAEQIAWMHVSLEPPRPSALQPDVDRGLEAIILKALQKDPARRHQSARELRAELRGLLEAQAPRQASLAPTAVARAPAAAPAVAAPAAGRAVVRPADTDDGLHVIPAGAMPTFQRDDAIDIGDLLGGGGGRAAGSVKEQAWVLGEKLATALLQDPAGAMARVEAIADPAAFADEMVLVERALTSLLTRGAAASLAVVVSRLLQVARGAAPGESSRQALASRALHSIAKPELLLRLADVALEGAAAERDPARWLLVQLGPTGAHALCSARVRASAHGAGWPGRPRFVAALRELAGSPAGAAAALRTLETFLQQADRRDVALVEDLLRAVPEVPDERLGTLVGSRELRHEAPAVRRAAVAALAATWGPRGNAWFAPLLEDPDDGVRIAALIALRRHGGVDKDLVQRLGRILESAPIGPDARLAAVAALGDARGLARTAAAELLAQALQASAGGRLGKLVAGESRADDAIVVAMARVLLAIAGPEAARLVEARAARSGAELRRELLALAGAAAAAR